MKRPKPNKNLPQLWLSEKEDRMFLSILYPKGYGWAEILVFDYDHDWYDSYYDVEMLIRNNKLFGWKTHFLGNL